MGDLYSVSWLEDADSAFPRESLQRQMAKVVKETKESHVQIFGDTSFAGDFADAFEGDAKDKHGYLRGDATAQVRKGVDARQATLSYYRSRAKAGLPGAREAYLAELAFRTETSVRFDAIAHAHGVVVDVDVVHRGRGFDAISHPSVAVDVESFTDETWACYKAAVDAVRLSCPRGISDEFVLGHVGMLGALCAQGAPDVAASVRSVCA